MYEREYWKDQVEIGGEVKVHGTLQDARHFNALEEACLANDEAARYLFQLYMSDHRQLELVTPVVNDVKLTNSKPYPWSNATASVAINPPRATTNYKVDAELISCENGNVENVEIYDKLTNGYKVRYSGSARSAKIKCYLTGGND